jgi:glycosyltransferase involved in cell wall biosynthesis
MRVAYVTTGDARDPNLWSGLANRIARCLEAQGMELTFIGNLREAWGPYFKAKHAFHKCVLRRPYTREREPVVARGFGGQVRKALAGGDFDAVASPGTIPVALLECRQPIVTWADATFPALLDYYPNCTNLPPGSVRMGMELERAALARIAAPVYASSWAAESAVRDCGADPAKVRVVPFGAILPDPPSAEQVEAMITARSPGRCRILFISVDWHRKGGDVAREAARLMNEAGVPTELYVVGTAPPGPVPPFVKACGFVNKYTPDGRATMNRLIAESHFLIMPSLAEAYGLAPCEANAFGVPAMTSATGGLNDIVRDGQNGFRFPVGTSGAQYATKMLELLRNADAYRELSRSSRREYETRLNWDVSGRRMRQIVEEVVAARRAS